MDRPRLREIQDGQRDDSVHGQGSAVPEEGWAELRLPVHLRTPGLAATYDAVRIQAGHNTVLVDALATGKKAPITAELDEAAKTVLLTLSR